MAHEYEELKDILTENQFKKIDIQDIRRKIRIAEICESNLKNGNEIEQIQFVFDLKHLFDRHAFFAECQSLADFEEILDKYVFESQRNLRKISSKKINITPTTS